MLAALLFGILCGFVGAIPIAGPTAVLVVERALSHKILDALEIALGGAVAEAFYAGFAYMGMTAALERLPWLVPASRIVGAVILLALGLYFALGPSRAPKEHTDEPAPRRGGKVVIGFVVTAINPTLLVSWSAVVAMLHGTGALRVDPLDGIPFAIGVGSGTAGWFAVFLTLLKALRDRFHHSTLDRVVRVMGWILVAVGLALVVNLVRVWLA